MNPLSQCYHVDDRRTIVIVVDALDECADEADVKSIIALLADLEHITSVRVRVMVTSRPEVAIRRGFRQSGIRHRELILHNVSKEFIDADIRLFLEHELHNIKAARSETENVEQSWPGTKSFDRLVDLSASLFIYAATVCRWVAENQTLSLQDCLLTLIDSPEASGKYAADPTKTWYLDQLYLHILEQAVPAGLREPSRTAFLRSTSRILCCLMLLQESIPLRSLERLLETKPDDIRRCLQNFHSVIKVPAPGNDHEALQLYHPSFRDFLLDKTRCQNQDFCVPPVATHEKLAKCSLRLLSDAEVLHKDLCKVKSHGTWRRTVSINRVRAHIEGHVSYACGYWMYHTVHGRRNIRDNGEADVLAHEKFLYWLEALAWTGRLSESIAQIDSLIVMLGDDVDDTKSGLATFFSDARQFILHNRTIIEAAPLQLYSSALVFAPLNSCVRKIYGHHIPSWISLLPTVASKWSPVRMELFGHQDAVTLVCYSPDGKLIASASSDGTIKIWDSKSGKGLRTLRSVDYADNIQQILFLPGCNILLVVSLDQKEIEIWDADSGEELENFDTFDQETDSAYELLRATGGDDKLERTQGYDTAIASGSCVIDNPQLVSLFTALDIKIRRSPGTGRDEIGRHWLWDPRTCFSSDGKRVALVEDSVFLT